MSSLKGESGSNAANLFNNIPTAIAPAFLHKQTTVKGIITKTAMKKHSVFAFLSLFLFTFYNCSLPSDDEEEGGEDGKEDLTYSLPWNGETNKFAINAKEGIHLNDPDEDAGTAYVTTPSTTIKDTRWEFGVQLTFNPSANNYARFYLASTSDVLSGSLNGYFVQIGGAKDNVTLYRQNGNQPQLLASGREMMKGNNSPKLFIKAECDKNGYWTLWTRLNSEKEYTKEKQVKDTHITNSLCCGIYCVYTKSRCDGITFHHVEISNGVETVSPGENPGNPEEPDTPSEPELPEEVRGMLLLNEVMYDNATNGAEYIELYNPANVTVSVPSLKLIRYIMNEESGNTETTTTAILQQAESEQAITVPPHCYICFTKSTATLMIKHKVNDATIIEVAQFPKITNEGGYLAILTNEEKPRIIDTCSYLESMHSSGNNRNQGISLEKKSPELKSSLNKNWHSSKNATGGTPGIKNE